MRGLDPMPDTATLLRLKAQRESGALPSSSPLQPRSPVAPTPTALTLTLPWSALQTGNRFYGLTSKGYRAAKAAARDRINEQCPRTNALPLFYGPVRLVVTLYMPNEQRRDLLNYAKLIGDAMTNIVYRDDSQIHDAHFVRLVDVDSPRAVITVTPSPAPAGGAR